MEKRYTALRLIATVYKVLGVIALIITLLAVVGFCLAGLAGGGLLRELGRGPNAMPLGGAFGGLIAGGLALLYGGGLAVTLYGLGEAIYLLIALEENTRATVQLLQKQISS
jgi:ABC-type phosphate transport system permease subunit